MAVSGRATSVYIFAITSMATVVIILVHLFLSVHKVSFDLLYIWEAVILFSAILGLVYLTCTRGRLFHLDAVQQNERTVCDKVEISRCIIIIVCAAGSGILPFYQVYRDVQCMVSTPTTLYVSKFFSLVLLGVFFFLEFIFLIPLKNYRSKSCFARILVSIVMSANACMLVNFILNIIRTSNTYVEPEDDTNMDLIRNWVFSRCENKTELLDNVTSVAEHMFKYTNPFLLELSFLAFGILVPLWNIPDQVNVDRIINRTESNDFAPEGENTDDNDADVTEEDVNLIGQNEQCRLKIVRTLKKILMFVSRYALVFSLIIVLTVFGFHINSEVAKMKSEHSDVVIESHGSNQTLTSLEKVNYYLQTFYNYIVSIVPFIGYFTARDIHIPRVKQSPDTILLIVSGGGHLLLVLLETADSIAGFVSQTDQSHLTEEIFFFVKILFHYVGIYYQITLIIKARYLHTARASPRLQVIKGMMIFLCLCNTERWLVDSFLPPTNLRFINDIQKEDTFGVKNWWFITEILFPIVTFNRLISALLCFEVVENMRRNGI
ncbi:uncharacterized protein LOC132750316 [Ruditapes philippinarum]|uniref:uncharacterized protein LOC132750316 n=1 Tax=Ruditapes philippinarum TaxID=129788 RepID=UPI00295A99E5|nr:uncharacterized protein LOC132750316 [Ruditapes philippinarum]